MFTLFFALALIASLEPPENPVTVSAELVVDRVWKVTPITDSFGATGTLVLSWQDPRLLYPQKVAPSEIWHPAPKFSNYLGSDLEPTLEIVKQGEVKMALPFKGEFSQVFQSGAPLSIDVDFPDKAGLVLKGDARVENARAGHAWRIEGIRLQESTSGIHFLMDSSQGRGSLFMIELLPLTLIATLSWLSFWMVRYRVFFASVIFLSATLFVAREGLQTGRGVDELSIIVFVLALIGFVFSYGFGKRWDHFWKVAIPLIFAMGVLLCL